MSAEGGSHNQVLGLVGTWWRGMITLLDQHAGVTSLTADEAGHNALTALAAGRDLIAELGRWRPRLVVDALAAGETPARVATCAGFRNPREMAMWLLAWAAEQHQQGTMADAGYRQVIALAQAVDTGGGRG